MVIYFNLAQVVKHKYSSAHCAYIIKAAAN